MDAFFNWMGNHSSLPWLIGYFAVIAFIIYAYIWMIKFSIEFLKITGKYGFTVPKIIITGLFPSIIGVMSAFDKEPPFKLLVPLCIIACVAVSIWNIISYGIMAGPIFSVLHITAGLLCSIIAAAIIIVILFAVAMLFLGADSTTSSSGASAKEVECLSDGQLYYTEKNASGQLTLPQRGYAILRPSSYAGRFIDDYGNEYIAR